MWPFNLVDYCKWVTAKQNTVFKENILYAITGVSYEPGGPLSSQLDAN